MKGSNQFSVTAVFAIYQKLYKHFGKQYWWPAQTKLEIIIGAILTQNTSWTNVEKAINNLKKKKLLNLENLTRIPITRLEKEIRSAGFFRVKAQRIKSFLNFLLKKYSENKSTLKNTRLTNLRNELLSIHGIGEETADSILLYALNKPVFVVDAYTKRIFSRHKYFSAQASYADVQNFFSHNLPKSTTIYNEYHALLVRLAKEFCRKKPLCTNCPIKEF